MHRVPITTLILLTLSILLSGSVGTGSGPLKISKSKYGGLHCESKTVEEAPKQWFFRGERLNNSSKYYIWSNHDGDLNLKIINETLEDEGTYQCKLEDGSESSDPYKYFVQPIPTDEEENITDVYNGHPFNVSCGYKLGSLSQKCISARLVDDNNPKIALHSWVKFKETVSSQFFFNDDHQMPSFTVVDPAHHLYRCYIALIKDNDNCSNVRDFSSKGPKYTVFIPPHVKVETNASTVREGAPVELTCSVNSNTALTYEVAIEWTAIDLITRENKMISDNHSKHLILYPKSDIEVTCNVTNDEYVLRNSSSVNLTVAPDVTQKDVQVLILNCGNIIIQKATNKSNINVSFNDQEVTITNDPNNLNIGNATEIALYSVVNGVKGKEDFRKIPSCSSGTSKNVMLDLSWYNCSEPADSIQVKESVSKLLNEITENCSESVCPMLADENWNIKSATCNGPEAVRVTLSSPLPTRLLLLAIQAYCNTSSKCNVSIVEPSPSPSPSPSTTSSPTSTNSSMPNTKSGKMADWMLLCFITFGILVITFFILLILVGALFIRKLKKNRIKDQQLEAGSVCTTSVTRHEETSDVCTASVTGHEETSDVCNASVTRHEEQQKETQSDTSSISSRRQPECSSLTSSRDSMSICTTQSRLSRRSDSSHKPRNPSTLSSVSYRSNPAGAPTVVINVVMDPRRDHREQIAFPIDMKQLFDELGALQSERQTHESGIGSTDSHYLERSRVGSQQKSVKSSGYGGSKAPVEIQDPNILNPHGKSGFTSDSSSSTSGSNNSLADMPQVQSRLKSECSSARLASYV